MDSKPRFSRRLAGCILILSSVGIFLGPWTEVAFAQQQFNPGSGAGGGFPVVGIGGDITKVADGAYNNVMSQLTRAGVVAFFNALQQFAGKLAYDAANYIASGGKGQDAVYYKKGFGNYLKDVASDSAGEFIGSLSDSDFFKKIGVDLCQPKDPRLMANLQINLGNFFPGQQSKYSRPTPRCDFQQVIQNYSALYQTMSNDDVYKNAGISLNVNQSDIGSIARIYDSYQDQILSKVSGAEKQRTEGQGFRNIEGRVSEYTKTPSQTVKESTSQSVIKDPSQTQLAATSAILNNAFQQGPIQLAVYTASVFLNTLTSKLMKRIFEKGLGAFDFSANVVNFVGVDTVVTAGKTDARQANIDLRTPNIQKVADFEVMSEFIACPQPPTPRGLWNCSMDQPLAQAIQSRSDHGGFTIADALSLNNNYLHGNWQLIPDDADHAKDNLDQDCYQRAYCAANLQKLRLNRILPVGFEFAANSEENRKRCSGSQGCVQLQEVVKGFTDCNPQTGQRDSTHPWCHLIDSNWVITSVQQQCAASGYSETLLSSQIDQRKEECQDVQSCLKRDNKGQCVGGYGYCMADKTVYRFQGDECPANYASCRTYQNRKGDTISYLRNTLDYGVCDANNVGCLWYSTERTPDGTGWVGSTTSGPRIYFDKTLQPCDANNEGCTKLYQVNVGDSALNLLLNPSFERLNGSSTFVANWSPSNLPLGPPKVNEGQVTPFDDAGVSSAEIKPASVTTYSQAVDLIGARTYTLSFYTRLSPKANGDISATLKQFSDADLVTSIKPSTKDFRSAGCVQQQPEVTLTPANLSTDWRRFECSFASAPNAKAALLTVKGSGILFDAIQLEEGEYATDFVDGINTRLPIAHLKVAPDELACTGGAKDPTACKPFANICRQSEAGCQGYTDVASKGPEVPAILSANDLCPQTCVGYAEYRKSPSAFDLVHDVDERFDDPKDSGIANFIPSTAGACTEAEVGCEEFTNVEGSGQGGEQTAAFSYVRACEKPDKNSQTYFTWEGSDTTGYQLRTWSLKKGDKPTLDKILGGGSAVDKTPGGPTILQKRAPGQALFKEPVTCQEATWRTGLDVDCRQFYDANGNVFYRYYSQTVLSADECINYRLNKGTIDDCKNTGGSFNSGTGECLYQVHVPESRACSAQAVGCRAYTGTGAGNIQTVLTQNFKEGKGIFSNGEKSNESLLVGDSSLQLKWNNNKIETSVQISSTDHTLYNVSFWAKAPVVSKEPLTFAVADVNEKNGKAVSNVKLTPDWQRYTLGPFSGFLGSTTSTLLWTVSTNDGKAVVYLDEVLVSRVQDVAYIRRDTWKTPLECDQSASRAPQPQAMLGCRTYRDRNNQSFNVKSFTRLCRSTSIGCSAFIDTRNSPEVGSNTFVMADKPAVIDFGPATTTRGADRYLYLIDEPSKRCQSENASCRAFGKPNFTIDRQSLGVGSSTPAFSTVYFKDEIGKYSEALCRPSEVFCEEFAGVKSKEYFKNPDNHVCEYRENVRLEDDQKLKIKAGSYSGWFQKGTQIPCYPEYLESGTNYGMVRRGDNFYRGWGALCPEEQAECTEFRDSNDTSDPLHRGGKPYFFVQNENLDTKSCTEGVDLGTGCILLRDMSASILKYNIPASYAKYRANNFKATKPLDCEGADKKDAFCQTTVCKGTETITGEDIFKRQLTPETKEWIGSACIQDSQCVYDVTGDKEIINLVLFNKTHSFKGTCQNVPGITLKNDANTLMKVDIDRDCAQWLGCKSAETVFDTATNKYKDVCTNLALCDKSSSKEGDVFCANYVDRSSTSTERTLVKGAYFDINQYTTRKVGLGEKDYTGYAIPNTFQIPDLVSTKVGADSLNTPDAGYRFALDYRLAAAVEIPEAEDLRKLVNDPKRIVTKRKPTFYDAEVVKDPNGVYAPLTLCQQIGTHIVGYYRLPDLRNFFDTGVTARCYLPVHAGSAQYNFTDLAKKFADIESTNDPALQRGFPDPTCRVYPELDSPYPASYVTDWDFSKNPPKPRDQIAGFKHANTCEYGEDCSCAYKRADYAGAAVKKFYGIYSDAVPPGICQGGPRDGQACIPEAIFKLPQQQTDPKQNTAITAAAGSNANQVCGPPDMGGRCLPFSKLELMRGIFGQCLEQDSARVLGTDQSQHPCLTWNPTPILFGEKDPYHFVPSSGYSPPQNSGQYYCLSKADPPKKVTLQSRVPFVTNGPDAKKADNQDLDDFDFGYCKAKLKPIAAGNRCEDPTTDPNDDKKSKYYAGQMIQLAFDDSFVANSHPSGGQIAGAVFSGGLSAIGWRGNSDGAFLAGPVSPDGSPTSDQCEDAKGGQSDDNNATDQRGLRLVGTGRSLEQSYTEAFFRLSSPRQYQEKTGKQSIAYIKIAPIANPNGKGRLGCGYQADWVDGLDKVDYGDEDNVAEADKQWRDKFYEKYNPTLTRGTEDILGKPDDDTRALPTSCPSDPSQNCFVKYWQTGYRDNPEEEFLAFKNVAVNKLANDGGLEYIRQHPVARKCAADKPNFSIRAVFETATGCTRGNNDAPCIKEGNTLKNEVSGSWKLVGFWVSSCAGQTNDNRFIYMSVDIYFGDVCREIAEVRSKDSHQDAAFTDRVWKSAGYSIPSIGIQYGARFAPFSSALNTGPAGADALFQTGGATAGFSRFNKPSFLSAGVDTYYRNNPNPGDKWGYLTNIFARIYRIYSFYDQTVTKRDKACLTGPQKGLKCAPDSKLPNRSLTCDPPRPDLCFIPEQGALVCAYDLMTSCGVDDDCDYKNHPDDKHKCVAVHKQSYCGGIKSRPCNNNIDCGHLSIDGKEIPDPLTTHQCVPDMGRAYCNGKKDKPCSNNLDCGHWSLNDNELPGDPDDDHYCKAEPPEKQFSGICSAQTKNFGLACDPASTDPNDHWFPANICGALPDLVNICGPVSIDAGGGQLKPDPNYCKLAGTNENAPTGDDPDHDNNACTHKIGYYPRQDFCPEPTDEFCGLFAYNIKDPISLNPAQGKPLPTDVTLGHYTPANFGFGKPADFNYISYYNPRPPRLAAPATKDCISPGRCPVQRMDAFTLDGQSEGEVSVIGGQHKADLRFYAWAAHNQMPLRRLIVDWGDGNKQELPDARLKNHKPFCGVMKECSDSINGTKGGGLTCQTDTDCPAGSGTCVPIGTCQKNQNIACSKDEDCKPVNGVRDTCNKRVLFGNSGEACEANYFEFEHLYTCTGKIQALPDCRDVNGKELGGCSRDPLRVCSTNTECAAGDTCILNGLAAGPKAGAGCFDQQNNACRFTPKILLEDNWGWCTGECRDTRADDQGNVVDGNASKVLHKYGGCYAWRTLGSAKTNIGFNNSIGQLNGNPSECSQMLPNGTGNIRPWVVYPGALQLGASGQVGQ